MMDYYSILEIPKSASKIDVKKAYFRMIRKYPPDRMPDEFKKTREAYEILFDEHTRKEYDSIDSMPSIVKTYYNSGKQAMAEGDYESAVLRLKEITK
ncbi:MAG: DnaJ domain-containing protein, partial [Clostridiales bacterium]|nr:DnaJ domain-containing protein [Clostridiales bacterium]